MAYEMIQLETGLLDKVAGEILPEKSLRLLTSWHIGGPAAYYFRPDNLQDLQVFIKQLAKFGLTHQSLFWLGLGSNLLVRDGGFPGVVIHTHKALSKIENLAVTNDYVVCRVEAGVPCAKFARYVAKQGGSGAEFFAGIPGTMGGALAMNAGAFGGETWAYLDSVEVLTPAGEHEIRACNTYQVAYREVRMPEGEGFVAGVFKFPRGDAEMASKKVRELILSRGQSQPIGLLSCGSVFRNPSGHYAAELIEASKLKGKSIGDAVVSEKHANFIINRGEATAKDVESLIQHIQTAVYDAQGVQLMPEVHIIGVESK